MHKILAIDLGSKYGFALASLEATGIAIIASGSNDLKRKTSNLSIDLNHAASRFIIAKDDFDIMLSTLKPDVICFEKVYRWASAQAAFIYNGLLSQLLISCHNNQIPFLEFSPKEIKKAMTGNGNAKKIDMINWAKQKHTFEIVDDNHADALAIAYHSEIKARQLLCGP